MAIGVGVSVIPDPPPQDAAVPQQETPPAACRAHVEVGGEHALEPRVE